MTKFIVACATAIAISMPATAAWAASCDSLSSLAIQAGKVTLAQVVPSGQFAPARANAAAPNPFKDLPEFCRVSATLMPSSDSDIKIEVWLPSSGWNGKFQAVGNGGWAGVLSYPAMAEALRAGYATASTDTGHTTAGGSFALGHPERLVDFSWRAVHEMTVNAKIVIDKFYGAAPKFSYWNGCSTGGRQALKEAQQFPNDYDGIIAGAPANRTSLAIWMAHAVKEPANYIPPEKYAVVHQAVLAACDAGDGVKDGLIEDPTACKFDPSTLLCTASDGPSCLTAAQVATAKKFYASPVNPRTGKIQSAPLLPGTELGWGDNAGPIPNQNILDQYRYIVFKDVNWDWKTFNFDSDAAKGELPENLMMNATDPKLDSFFAHGGKLLMYQGWNDPRVPGLQTVGYYQSVVDLRGGAAKAASDIRLFMVPGMGHCGGGEGPNEFDKMGPLEQWVEHGKAPDTIAASHRTAGKVDRTRPLCAYPKVAKYKGSGSIDDAASFVCSAK